MNARCFKVKYKNEKSTIVNYNHKENTNVIILCYNVELTIILKEIIYIFFMLSCKLWFYFKHLSQRVTKQKVIIYLMLNLIIYLRMYYLLLYVYRKYELLKLAMFSLQLS